MRYEKADRVMQLALALQASRAGLTLLDIEDRFAVGRRTAQRMRDAVVRLFPYTRGWIDGDGRRRWRIPPAATPDLVSFTADEIADLEASAALLRRENMRSRAKSLTGIATKIRASLPDEAARRIEPDLEVLLEAEGLALRPRPRPAIDAGHLSALRLAIKQGRQVYLRYRSRRSGRRTGRKLHPYGFLFGSRHYLVAYCPRASEPKIRLFALAGIRGVKIVDEVFERPAEFSLGAFAERSFGVFQEEPVDVAWLFSPAAAPSAKEYVFHPTQTLEERPDGSLLVRFRAGGLLEMCWHAYTWGPDLTVLAPPALIEMCRTGPSLARASAGRARRRDVTGSDRGVSETM